MTATRLDCRSLAPALAAHVRGRLAERDAVEVDRHLAACPACRATAAALGAVWRTSRGPARPLWPRLRTRLAEEEAGEWVRLRFPSLTWPVGTAAAAAGGVLALVPEPLRFLAAFGIL
jgi:anti-sigma factor RsiW